jgi:hypothetical protein
MKRARLARMTATLKNPHGYAKISLWDMTNIFSGGVGTSSA